jgi:hypothetical protein
MFKLYFLTYVADVASVTLNYLNPNSLEFDLIFIKTRVQILNIKNLFYKGRRTRSIQNSPTSFSTPGTCAPNQPL